jgi:hypothetical protein
MSAVKDSAQGTTFIYTNFYHLYQKSKLESEKQKPLAKGLVLKSNSLTAHPSVSEVRVVSPEQLETLSQWSHGGIQSSYRSLRNARKRLKFLMGEIDELLKATG